MSHPLAAGGNFLIPNMTFVVELAAFLIVLGVLRRYVIPPVQQAMTAKKAALVDVRSPDEFTG